MTLEQRKAFEDKLSVMRRLILGADIAILADRGLLARHHVQRERLI